MEQQYPPQFKPAPDEEDWIDKYAPKETSESDYFHGRGPEPELPKHRGPKKRRWPWIIIVLLLVATTIAVTYVLTTKKTTSPTTTTATQIKSPQPTEDSAVATKHYDSSNFNLGIEYPTNWTLTDTADKLTVLSPTTEMKLGAGKPTSAHVLLTIQPRQTTIASFKSGAATATLQSNKISYKNPTSNQRAQTYLTYLTYADSTGSGLDALYLTGDNGYAKGQNIPVTDVIQSDPLVTVSFINCADNKCNGTPVVVQLLASDWQKSTLASQVQTMLQSLTLN